MTRARLNALKLAFPKANILGAASGIVGTLGLIVSWVDPESYLICTKSFEPGETIPILVIVSDQLQIDVGVNECIKKFVVNHSVFSNWQ